MEGMHNALTTHLAGRIARKALAFAFVAAGSPSATLYFVLLNTSEERKRERKGKSEREIKIEVKSPKERTDGSIARKRRATSSQGKLQ